MKSVTIKSWIYEDNDTVSLNSFIITISVFQYFFSDFVRLNVDKVHDVKVFSCRNAN